MKISYFAQKNENGIFFHAILGFETRTRNQKLQKLQIHRHAAMYSSHRINVWNPYSPFQLKIISIKQTIRSEYQDIQSKLVLFFSSSQFRLERFGFLVFLDPELSVVQKASESGRRRWNCFKAAKSCRCPYISIYSYYFY